VVATFEEGTRDDGGCVVRLGGEIDLAVADELVTVILGCFDRADDVEVDFGGVTFIDSSGLGALVRVRNEATARGKRLSLVDVGRPTTRLLEITGLLDAFDIRPRES
jgi:anti-anti-sigma factor